MHRIYDSVKIKAVSDRLITFDVIDTTMIGPIIVRAGRFGQITQTHDDLNLYIQIYDDFNASPADLANYLETVGKYSEFWFYRREIKRVQRHLRRALKVDLPASLTIAQWLKALEDCGGRCFYCGKPYQSIEHLTPIASRGGTTAANCVPACCDCNNKMSFHVAGHTNLSTQRRYA